MPQLISAASQAPTIFDTLVASPFDLGNIQDAFMYYHYGINNKGESPDPKSIHSYLKNSKNIVEDIDNSLPSLLETYDFVQQSSGSLQVINDLDVSNSLANVKKYIYASYNVQVGNSYTLQISDNRKIIILNNNDFFNVFIPNDAQDNFAIGFNFEIISVGNNFFSIIPQSGVTVRGAQLTFSKKQGCTIYKRATNDWIVVQ
jgi:hypothetical protein